MNNNEFENPQIKLFKSAEELASAMEKSDKYLKSRKIIESINNWMIGVSAGTLLWIMANFDKFYLKSEGTKEFFHKEVFISITLIILISLIFLMINRYRLDSRNYIMYGSIDSIQSLAQDVLECANVGATGDELADYCQKGTENAIQKWIRGHNLIDLSLPLLKSGVALYIIGIFSFVVYFIYYLIQI